MLLLQKWTITEKNIAASGSALRNCVNPSEISFTFSACTSFIREVLFSALFLSVFIEIFGTPAFSCFFFSPGIQFMLAFQRRFFNSSRLTKCLFLAFQVLI